MVDLYLFFEQTAEPPEVMELGDGDDGYIPPPSKRPVPFWQTAHFLNKIHLKEDKERIARVIDAFYDKWTGRYAQPLTTEFRILLDKLKEWVLGFETEMQRRRIVGAQLCYLEKGFNLLEPIFDEADKLEEEEMRWRMFCRLPEGEARESANAYRVCNPENVQLSYELQYDTSRLLHGILGCNLKGVHLFLNYMKWFQVAIPPLVLQEVRWNTIRNLEFIQRRCADIKDKLETIGQGYDIQQPAGSDFE